MSDDAKAAPHCLLQASERLSRRKSRRRRKIAYLKKISYRDYLRKDAGWLGDEAVKFLRWRDQGACWPWVLISCRRWRRWAASTRASPASDSRIRLTRPFDEPYIYHFPDGQRLNRPAPGPVGLIPGVAPGHTMDDVLLAEFDYTQLDRGGAPLRLPPEQHSGDRRQRSRPRGGPVDIGYVRSGELHRVQARQCVLACYNMMIPHIMPELPDAPKAGARPSVSSCRWSTSTSPCATGMPSAIWGVNEILQPSWLLFEHQASTTLCRSAAIAVRRDPGEPILLHMEHIAADAEPGPFRTRSSFRLGRLVLLEYAVRRIRE